MGRLDGKIAAITGGSAGLGLAIAREFVEQGAQVVLLGRRESALQAAALSIGPAASYVSGDVTRPAALDALFSAVRERHGGLDVLVANAGGVGGGPVATCSEQDYDALMELNVKSVFFTVQKAIPLLRSPAAIVVMGSTSSEIALPGGSVYSASKAALRSFVRSWAAELAPLGVRVNLVGPGPTDTPLVESIDARGGGPSLDQLIRTRGAIHRRGRMEEVAAAVRFLSSDESSWITGAALFVDGGIAYL
jgi:NAD(P)-dependent dehydrogenase (short-subunit alcohol dehydrogenase family)